MEIAFTCSHNGEPIRGCGQRTSVSLPNGYSPALGVFTIRVPPGELSLEFSYGEHGARTLDVNVPERIVGINRDVWECFSDIPCAGWYSAEVPIQKWNQASPLKVWASGPESFIEVFKSILDELGPVLGLEFEWVSTEDEAEFVAYIGYTLPEGSYRAHPDEAGYATIGGANKMGELNSGEIGIKDTWGEATFHQLPEPTQKFLVHVLTHESIHTLSSMNHGTELDSIMNNEGLGRLKLSPMDERLLRLHGHPLVKPGMAMAEIEKLIIFDDELIDPQVDADLIKRKLVFNAYDTLRQAESATFRVRSSDCHEQFGWADYTVYDLWTDYTVYDLENHSFAWVGIDDGSERFYVYGGRHGADEYWHREQGGWSQVSSQWYVDATPGWDGDLSDPHSMIESVLRYADWADARLVTGPDGLAKLEFEFLTFRGDRLKVDIVLDPETGMISKYSMDWEQVDETCGTYRVEAEDGQYHSTFEFPDALRERSKVLGHCGGEVLGPISGAVSLSGTWSRHCGGGADGYRKSYRFSVEDWSYVRVEVSSANRTSLHLLGNSGSGELTVDESFRYGRSIRHGWIWDHWTQAIIPPGEYTIELVTHDRVLIEFGLAIHTSVTHQPPHSFQSISSGHEQVCVLDSDRIAVCWGSNGELFAWPPYGEVSILAPSNEKFMAISSGTFYACGLNPDGTPVCWGRDNSGQTSPPAGEKFVSISSGWEHNCALRSDGTPVCWGANHAGESSPPAGEKFISISSGGQHNCALRADGTPVCWGVNYDGRASPPTGEKFVSISSGRYHTCALRSDRTPVCWGDNYEGQTSPPAGEKFVSISSGSFHTCALRSDGTVACWGGNFSREPSSPFP